MAPESNREIHETEAIHLFRARLTLCTICTTLFQMSSAYISGRVPSRYERLVVKQARAARTSKSDLVARYVIEK